MVLSERLLSSFQRVLVLCAHTDDEYGCAGTVHRMIQLGVQVHYIAMSRCEESVPAPYPPDILEKECRVCTTRLGFNPQQVEIWDFKVRYFPEKRQEILERLVRVNKQLQPDLVLLPSSFDTHQDHQCAHVEGFRAFKHVSILGYELPQNLNSFANTAFIKLDEADLGAKLDALGAYESQISRSYSADDFIRGLARVRGVQCNAEYAEAFEVIRLVI